MSGELKIEGGLRSLGVSKLSSDEKPLFSIITVVFNGELFIRETIESVLSQSYDNVEYIVLDGRSTDDTLKIIQNYDQFIDYWCSSDDDGMYDALSKGFSLCNGKYIGWINADDKLMPWALESVVDYFKRTGSSWVTGIPAYWDKRGLLRYVGTAPVFPATLIKYGWFNGQALGCIQQESTFFSSHLLSSLGFEEMSIFKKTRYAGDFFLWKVFASRATLDTLPTVLSGFRWHGKQLSQNKNAYFKEVNTLGGKSIPFPFRALAKAAYKILGVIIGGIRQNLALNRFLQDKGRVIKGK